LKALEATVKVYESDNNVLLLLNSTNTCWKWLRLTTTSY
jgi:hypothetical protein